MAKDSVSGKLAGRRVVVTGGGSGIGKAIVELFVREGARVAAFDINASGVPAFDGVTAFEVDISQEDKVQAAVAGAAEALGGIDGLVNNAAVSIRRAFADLSLEDWSRTMATNLTGPYLVTRACLPWLQKSQGAAIVNMASGAGLRPTGKTGSAYAATKGGILALTRALAFEFAPDIRVNAMCPGAVDTPMLSASARSTTGNREMSPYPLGRIADPAEIASAALFLISGDSSYVTGATLAVDGGRTFH